MIKTQIYLPLSTQNSHINEITNPRSFFDQHSATPYTHLARSRSSDLTHRTSCTQSASITKYIANYFYSEFRTFKYGSSNIKV